MKWFVQCFHAMFSKTLTVAVCPLWYAILNSSLKYQHFEWILLCLYSLKSMLLFMYKTYFHSKATFKKSILDGFTDSIQCKLSLLSCFQYFGVYKGSGSNSVLWDRVRTHHESMRQPDWWKILGKWGIQDNLDSAVVARVFIHCSDTENTSVKWIIPPNLKQEICVPAHKRLEKLLYRNPHFIW